MLSQCHLLKKLCVIFLKCCQTPGGYNCVGFLSQSSMCLVFYQHQAASANIALWYNSKEGMIIPLTLFIFLRITSIIQRLWGFRMHFNIVCSLPIKNGIGIFMGIVLNMQIAFGRRDVLYNAIFLTHGHGGFVHLPVSPLIPFLGVLKLPLQAGVFHFPVQNCDIFKAAKNVVGSCVLIQIPATLLKVLITWWGLQGHSYTESHHIKSGIILFLAFLFETI